VRFPFLPVDQYSIRLAHVDDEVLVLVVRRRAARACPDCGRWSRRLHSRRGRTVLDVPVGSRSVRLRLVVRRFFCTEPACPRTTFTEPFPHLVGRYARRTARLERLLGRLALAMSAEAASRIARALGIPVSPDTLVRLVISAATVQLNGGEPSGSPSRRPGQRSAELTIASIMAPQSGNTRVPLIAGYSVTHRLLHTR